MQAGKFAKAFANKTGGEASSGGATPMMDIRHDSFLWQQTSHQHERFQLNLPGGDRGITSIDHVVSL
jgi:hypothetical protein